MDSVQGLEQKKIIQKTVIVAMGKSTVTATNYGGEKGK